MGTWDLDLATGGMVWSDGLFRILDIEPDEAERQPGAVLAFIHPQDREALGALIGAMRDDPDSHPGDVVTHDYRVVRSDGTVAEVRARGRLVRDEQGAPVRWVGSIQDVTSQRRSERALLARAEVTRALHDWESFDEGVVDLLRRIGHTLGSPIASLWLWDEAAGALRCRAAWQSPDVDVTGFLVLERDRAVRPGEEVVGRAWRERRAVSVGDLTLEPASPVRDAAVEHGIRAVLALPVVGGEDALGVVTLCATEPRSPDPTTIEPLSAVGREVGDFLSRHRASLGPAPLTPRELEVLRLAADGLSGPAIAREFVVSPSTVKTHFENTYEKLGVSDRASAVALGLRTGLLT